MKIKIRRQPRMASVRKVHAAKVWWIRAQATWLRPRQLPSVKPQSQNRIERGSDSSTPTKMVQFSRDFEFTQLKNITACGSS